MQINDGRNAAVDATLSRMAAAWDAGNARAFAAEFTEDASYVIFAGIVSLGRAEIEKAHVPVFEKWQKGSRMSMNELHRHISADAVIVVTEGGIGKGRRVRHDKVQTFVFVDDAGAWRCAAFQNTKKNGLFVRVNARAMASR
jgi:uncharacterized protein (TIGR02246 family)